MFYKFASPQVPSYFLGSPELIYIIVYIFIFCPSSSQEKVEHFAESF